MKPRHEEEAWTVEVDRVTAEEWGAALALFEDANLYQTWAYGAVRWGPRQVSHMLLKCDGEIVAMAQLRIASPWGISAGIAHLRWGPLVQLRGGDLKLETARQMADALHDEYVKRRGLFLRILPNANKDTPRGHVFQSAFPQYRSEPFGPGDSYRTLVLDLASPLEIIRKKLDQKWRNQLNRAERNGLTIQQGDEADNFQAFIRIFDEMWARKRFALASDIREFERIQRDLPRSQKMKIFICSHEGMPAAGLVGTAIGNTGIYLFGATSERGMKLKGAYLLQWRMIEWLKENGVRYYDLGGINPQTNPGVYHFKQGLSGDDVLHMNPLVACDRIASRAFARTADMVRGRFRHILSRLPRRA